MSLSKNIALASALALGSAPMVAVAAPAAVVHKIASDKAPVAAQQASTDYAQREAQDKQAADFQGGNTVIIGISGGALLVLLFLLLII